MTPMASCKKSWSRANPSKAFRRIAIVSGGALGGSKNIRVMLVLDILAALSASYLMPDGGLPNSFSVIIGEGQKLRHVAADQNFSARRDQIRVIERHDHAGFDHLRFHLGAVAGQSFIVILRFAALHGEARVGAIVVAGDVIVLESEQIERQTKAHVLGATHAESRGAKLLCLDKIAGLFHARRYVGANVRDGNAVHAGDESEFAQIDAQPRIFELLVE